MLSIKVRRYQRILYYSLLFLSVIVFTIMNKPSYADEVSEYLDGILVEEATLNPILNSDKAQLHFTISNYGRINVTLKEITSPAATEVSMFFLTPMGKKQTVSNLSILVEETLDLNSSHIIVELSGLKKPLIKGAKVEFELIFNEFKTSAIADIH